jgi:hypothetical protein
MRDLAVYFRLGGFVVILLLVTRIFEDGGWPLFLLIAFTVLAIVGLVLSRSETSAASAFPTKSAAKEKRAVAVTPKPAGNHHVHRASSVPTAAVSIDQALATLPPWLLERSGSLFYTGREAFIGRQPLYLLGLNPGGDPDLQRQDTIRKALVDFRARQTPWSAYQDDSWQGAAPGTWGMQPRVLHMLKELNCDPRLTPASNVVFARSRDEAALRSEKSQLLKLCWPVHQTVIDHLGVKVIVCFGATAGKWVREQIGANRLIGEFRERNGRGWKSEAHQAINGRAVVTVTHPGRVDWRNPAADPTPLVRQILDGR